jgi:hypothetical protein
MRNRKDRNRIRRLVPRPRGFRCEPSRLAVPGDRAARGAHHDAPRQDSAVAAGPSHAISTEILEAGADEDRAWAHVAGWTGPKHCPRTWVEEVITIVFQVELEWLRLEAAKKGCPLEITFDPYGPRLRLLDPRAEEDALATLKEQKQIARDMVIATATSRVVNRLLGREWRGAEEIAVELAMTERAK